jgi:hypothetical protein
VVRRDDRASALAPTLLSGRPDTTSHPAHTARAHRLTPHFHHHRRFYDWNDAAPQSNRMHARAATACTRARTLPPCIIPHAPSSPPRHTTASPKCRPILHAAELLLSLHACVHLGAPCTCKAQKDFARCHGEGWIRAGYWWQGAAQGLRKGRPRTGNRC